MAARSPEPQAKLNLIITVPTVMALLVAPVWRLHPLSPLGCGISILLTVIALASWLTWAFRNQ